MTPGAPANRPWFEALESRLLLSAAVLGVDGSRFTFTDADGDRVTVRLAGPGTATITLDGDAADFADIDAIVLAGTTDRSRLTVTVKRGGGGEKATTLGSISGDALGTLKLPNVTVNGAGVHLAGGLRSFKAAALANGADLILNDAGRPLAIDVADILGEAGNVVVIQTPGVVKTLRVRGDVVHTTFGAAGDVGRIIVSGDVRDSLLLAGADLGAELELNTAVFGAASIRSVKIGGNLIDAIIAAGGDPGADGLFENGEVLAGGVIKSLKVGGVIVGTNSPHPNPGIYAAELGKVHVNGVNLDSKAIAAGVSGGGVLGTAVIDPLPLPANALSAADVEAILENAIARATQLGVNATIAITDREGNILATVRMTDPALIADPGVSTVSGGGVGGLEGVTLPSSIFAVTKAGTAAFLSTEGNAFTTRTAGFIIQDHFPPGVRFQDSGPLFGVQFSSLPTSDVNRLPIGLAADPGGVPLYRNGQVVGGLGVELDGVYTIDPSGVGGSATTEEKVALAGQIGYQPPKKIRADRVFVDGLRLDYANASPPKQSSLAGALRDLATPGLVDLLVAPRPQTDFASRFAVTTLGSILGEAPDNADLDFFDAGALSFLAGDANPGDGVTALTAADVELILTQAHALNDRLRAQIRKDRPQKSQVSVAVVDLNGNVLGVFRTLDAPVFGYDVAVQKARTAAFFSRADASDELRELDAEVDVLALFGNAEAYGEHVDAAARLGLLLDGFVAISDRTGGFLSRPNLPDGIPGAPTGPFAAQAPEVFSGFNTGLQTKLMLPSLLDFVADFLAFGDEGAALAAFQTGIIGGDGTAPGSLPGLSLNNGAQIFPGSVPLYKDGLLVGAVGVSGDGVEQDDYIAFAGAQGFQELGAVTRADHVTLPGNIRLPYVKFPRTPFGGF